MGDGELEWLMVLMVVACVVGVLMLLVVLRSGLGVAVRTGWVFWVVVFVSRWIGEVGAVRVCTCECCCDGCRCVGLYVVGGSGFSRILICTLAGCWFSQSVGVACAMKTIYLKWSG